MRAMDAMQALRVVVGLAPLDEAQQLRVAVERARTAAEDARVAAEVATRALANERARTRRLIAVRCEVCDHLYVVDHAVRPQPLCPACDARAGAAELDEMVGEEGDSDDESTDTSCILCGVVGGDGTYFNMATGPYAGRVICSDCRRDGMGEVRSFF